MTEDLVAAKARAKALARSQKSLLGWIKKYSNDSSRVHRDKLIQALVEKEDSREILTTIATNGDAFAGVFVRAGSANHADILEAFLNTGMHVDIKNGMDRTALMNACERGCEEAVRFLLERDANVDLQDVGGCTALTHASLHHYPKIVELLLEKNADVDIQNENGHNALMCASYADNVDIVQLLLNHGANIDLKDKDGKRALVLAKSDAIKELLKNHVNNSYVLK